MTDRTIEQGSHTARTALTITILHGAHPRELPRLRFSLAGSTYEVDTVGHADQLARLAAAAVTDHLEHPPTSEVPAQRTSDQPLGLLLLAAGPSVLQGLQLLAGTVITV